MAVTVEAPRNPHVARLSVMGRTEQFPHKFLEVPHRTMDGRTFRMLDDLRHGRYWDVLHGVNGSTNPYHPDDPRTKQDKRSWARQTFTQEELQELVQMSVDIALTQPIQTPWPASHEPYRVLYHAFVPEDEGSLWEGSVSEDFRHAVINGALWEAIPNSAWMMGRILEEHHSDLDVGFAAKGYPIFKANRGEEREPDLIHLSDRNRKRYKKFVDAIAEDPRAVGLNEAKVGFLTGPIKDLGSKREQAETKYLLSEVGRLQQF